MKHVSVSLCHRNVAVQLAAYPSISHLLAWYQVAIYLRKIHTRPSSWKFDSDASCKSLTDHLVPGLPTFISPLLKWACLEEDSLAKKLVPKRHHRDDVEMTVLPEKADQGSKQIACNWPLAHQPTTTYNKTRTHESVPSDFTGCTGNV